MTSVKKSRGKIQPKTGFLISVTRRDTGSTESTSIIIESYSDADRYASRLLSTGKYFSISISPV